ncbi:MAG: response regulator transcription factor [Campylobacteraceae bacterium]|nr:response regulator transcription factor [Campylobacteraceae bacterium]
MDDMLIKQLKDFSILCVEDEDGIRKRLVNTLKYYFNDIYDCNCGDEAYNLYLEYKPNIIITDIQMRNGDGIELVKRIRENDSSTKIIMLSAFNNEEYLMDLINLNINFFILKPLNSEKLIKALLSSLADKLNQLLCLSDDLYLDTAKREILFNEETVLLRKREKEFLELLYEQKDSSITSYTQIEERIWENKTMSNAALKTFIKELRKKIPKDIILNIPQEGYKLI